MNKSQDKTKSSIIRDWIVLVFLIILLPTFLFGILEGILQANVARLFSNLLISGFIIYAGLKYVKKMFAGSVNDQQISQKFYQNPKLRLRLIILAIIIVIVWGWYLSAFLTPFLSKNQDSVKVDVEYQEILADNISKTEELTLILTENTDCFDDEALSNGISAKCAVNLEKARNILNTEDALLLERLTLYYKENKASLDAISKKVIEDSIKLYNSEKYNTSMTAMDEYLVAYIEWHEYFRDFVNLKGVDNMTEEEIMRAKTLAENIVNTEENLQLKKTDLRTYMNQNFDEDFLKFFTHLSF